MLIGSEEHTMTNRDERKFFFRCLVLFFSLRQFANHTDSSEQPLQDLCTSERTALLKIEKSLPLTVPIPRREITHLYKLEIID